MVSKSRRGDRPVARTRPVARNRSPAFAESTPARPEMREIATTLDGRDITRGWLTESMQLPPQDPLLERLGGGDTISTARCSRTGKCARRSSSASWRSPRANGPWKRAAPGGPTKSGGPDFGDAEARRLRRCQPGYALRRVYGLGVAELLYARDGATIGIDAIKVRDRRRLPPLRRLAAVDDPRFSDGRGAAERKFWTFATGADHDDEPYGLGLAHWLYWPVQFKRGNIKFWLIAAEKFGSPTAVGWFPPGTSVEDRNRLLAALKAIQLDAGVILPEGMRAELLEAKRQRPRLRAAMCLHGPSDRQDQLGPGR